MIDFDIESFVRKRMTKRPESLLAADFARCADEMHRRIDGKRILVIGGAGTIGSNYVKAALRSFKPSAMYVVDIDENSLTELTRELRAGDYRAGLGVADDGCIVAKRARARFGKLFPEELRRFQESAYKANQ